MLLGCDSSKGSEVRRKESLSIVTCMRTNEQIAFGKLLSAIGPGLPQTPGTAEDMLCLLV